MTVEVDDALISDEARAKIGTELSRATGIVVKKEFQRWAAAVKDRNPLYFDEAYAKSMGYSDITAPPMYVQFVTFGVADLDRLRPDGIPSGGSGDIPLPKCPRRMAGGEEMYFYAPVYDGDVITAVRTCTDIVQKQGRSGAFVLASWNTTYTNQDGVLVAEIKASMIARP